eukprot:Nitzschia sp. Nitz4//scaffold25_size161228//119615//120433//NITZ4_002447-RA/size161228-snap-gene-0.29-mRNA-1//-1//CDS//3329544637//4645//frame0
MDSSTTTTDISQKALHVLVIAHPDDESMFFLPTIQALTQSDNETLWILCLTTGDYDGLGKIREKEMFNAGKLLGVKVIVNNTLKDHPTTRWSIPDVHKEIQETLLREISPEEWNRIVLITFDPYGVSGHVNHIDTYLGSNSSLSWGTSTCVSASNQKMTSSAIMGIATIPLEGWTLQSETNMIHKYFPLYCWILLFLSLIFHIPQERSILLPSEDNNQEVVVYRMHQPRINWLAMQTHHSQFVWYRRLFVIFSCYTYVNRLQSIRS